MRVMSSEPCLHCHVERAQRVETSAAPPQLAEQEHRYMLRSLAPGLPRRAERSASPVILSERSESKDLINRNV